MSGVRDEDVFRHNSCDGNRMQNALHNNSTIEQYSTTMFSMNGQLKFMLYHLKVVLQNRRDASIITPAKNIKVHQ